VGIIERHDNHVLIVLPSSPDDPTRLWQFPRGLANIDESPEQAMRRIADEQLGIGVEIVVGQPPVAAEINGREVEMRYFFCGVADEEPRPGPYAEIRWVTRGHLREYEFDDPSKPVVEWLLEP
jgi:ADP-ribose pyrophosphatase YjhB (NUDIX family)